ncbi:MAG: carboxypeptidase regulatory-like domain-containing protein [Apibacter sp.]|nr:carboxypeptidase regulatory-like domain-containing protein [Apibacter sp.]
MKIKLLSVLIFFCLISFSQDLRIQGKVTFEKSEFDKLAEVIVSKQDSILNSTVLEEDGFFAFSHLSPGNYTIEVKQWGKIVYEKNWDVQKDIDLGEIKVSLEKEIQQITVTGNKKLIERKVDRMVFNVENSVFSSGGDVLDLLKVTPRVKVVNDQIELIKILGLPLLELPTNKVFTDMEEQVETLTIIRKN